MDNNINAVDFNGNNLELPVYTVYKEFISGDMLCLDLLRGSEVSKCICLNSQLDAYITSIENYFKCKCNVVDTIPTKIDNPYYAFQAGAVYSTKEGKLNKFLDCLSKMETFPNMKLDTIGNSVSTLYMQFILYDKQHMTIKVPIQSVSSMNNNENAYSWDYKYLINIDGTLNGDTLSFLKMIYKEDNYQAVLNEFEKAFAELVSSSDIYFSCNYYLNIQRKYFVASECIRALSDIIRTEPTHAGYRSNYYILMQESRGHKKESSACSKFTYKGEYTRLSFNEYLSKLNIDKSSLTNFDIADENKREKFIEIAMKNDESKPLGFFVKHYYNTSYPDTAIMLEYEQLEKERQHWAKLIWMYHFLVKVFCTTFQQYIIMLNSEVYAPNPVPDAKLEWEINGCYERLDLGFYKPRKG